MEEIFEIILQIFLEGISSAVDERKLPLWVRIISGVIISVTFIAFIGLIGFLGIFVVSDGSFIGGAVILVAELIVTVFISNKLIKKLVKKFHKSLFSISRVRIFEHKFDENKARKRKHTDAPRAFPVVI